MAHTITKYDIFNAQDHYRRVMRLPEFKQLKLCQKKSVINLTRCADRGSTLEGLFQKYQEFKF